MGASLDRSNDRIDAAGGGALERTCPGARPCVIFRVLAKTSVASFASHSGMFVKCCMQHSPHAVIAMAKSVLVADDNAFVRQRLGELFSREPDFEVCAEVSNGRKAVEEAEVELTRASRAGDPTRFPPYLTIVFNNIRRNCSFRRTPWLTTDFTHKNPSFKPVPT
jgi:hypothetical protein